ncbi:MAG TPA: ABC transporter ATP-binding protein [Chitinophagales bacterium]|nr:ABC transporter ATP-binding protein [Chitinophagales bacterium]HQO31170.1 ABC transporter ATP-binding protein [Chitinophagales bacterium]HQO89463.1 ABC transporter ATP-binding protein [Chitinophagales bacterium]
MIELQAIDKQFGKLKALNSVSATFRLGECIALIGPNGCGKTTLIKSILGMVVPDKGTILFNGKDIRKDWQYRAQIGYMPQIGRYPENMNIGQVLDMMRNIRKENHSQMDEELLHAFQLPSMLDKRMGTLSGGTRQKVSASLAFMFHPDVLILDEPTAGLDPLAAELLKEKIIREKEKGKLILITSHILSELDDLITHIVYMQEGQLKFNKTTDVLREETGEARLSKAIAHIMQKQ